MSTQLNFSELFSSKNMKEVYSYLKDFALNPLAAIRTLPHWDWSVLIATAGLLLALHGVAYGLVNQKFLSILLGLTLVPIGGLIANGVFAGFFYYIILFLFNKMVPFKSLYTLMVIGSIPILFFRILAPIAPPFVLIGTLGTSLLLIVGLVENFKLPKKAIIKIVGTLLVIYTIMLSIQIYQQSQNHNSSFLNKAPSSLDQLERELKK